MLEALRSVFLVGFPPCNPILFAGLLPCNSATPSEKGVDPKTFFAGGNIFFMEGRRTRNAEPLIFGSRSMDPGRRSLCGCFVLSCMVGGIFRKPLGFRRCLPPARPEKAKPFQAGQGPCTKRPQTARLRLYEPKKVFRGSKGRFYKNAPLAGGGTASHKRRASQPIGVRLFRRDKVPARNTHRQSGFAFTNPKKFLGIPRGGFTKTRPWQGSGTESHKERESRHGSRLFGRDRVSQKKAGRDQAEKRRTR